MNNLKVSVIMPAYNAEEYIAEAIKSILDQTFENFEFIIIEDGSKDNTWRIIQEYAEQDMRIVALRNNQNLKLSKTLNRGIKIACGQYIARMDADDISLKDRLAKQISYMEQNPQIGISGGAMQIIDKGGKVIGQRRYHLTDSEIRKYIFRYSPFSHPLVIMKRSVLEKAGYYDNEYNPAEDYDLHFRLGQHSKFGNLSDILLKYRVISQSMTTGSTRKMELKTLDIRKKAHREYGYRMNFFDKVYWLLQYTSLFIVPSKIRIWLFNKIRNT